MLPTEFLFPALPSVTGERATGLPYAMRGSLVRLPDRERRGSKSPADREERDEREDEDDMRRWRCRRVGSTSGILAMRPKRDNTAISVIS